MVPGSVATATVARRELRRGDAIVGDVEEGEETILRDMWMSRGWGRKVVINKGCIGADGGVWRWACMQG